MIPFFMIAIGVPIVIGVGLVIMSLWNWIMPAVFGFGMITFWQALGMLILGRLLFGGFRKHRSWGMMRHKYAYVHCFAQKHNSCKNIQEEKTIAT